MDDSPIDDKRRIQISKFLSLVLRHNPAKIGIVLDRAGWTPIDELIERAAVAGVSFSRSEFDSVVANCPKQRFAISNDGIQVRANQGHSLTVDHGFAPTAPPPTLYHGTHPGVIDSIEREGLKKMARHHVHLSADPETASKVGERRGRPIILRVDAQLMVVEGHSFYLSTNGVWLTEYVPPQYLAFPTAL